MFVSICADKATYLRQWIEAALLEPGRPTCIFVYSCVTLYTPRTTDYLLLIATVTIL